MKHVEPYAPDDPAICDDNTPLTVTVSIIIGAVIIGNVALFGDIMAFWYWVMVLLLMGTNLLAWGMKVYDWVERLMPIEYDTSSITKKDVLDFMSYQRTLDELKYDYTALADEYLKSFIFDNHLWEADRTDCHFIYDGVQLFVAHDRVELKDHYSSDEDKFGGRTIKIEDDSNLYTRVKQVQSKYKDIQRERNGWVN